LADGIARSIFESMANKIWTDQNEIDPPGLRRDVESASERGGLHAVLNMLAAAKVITYRRGFAAEYTWFRFDLVGKVCQPLAGISTTDLPGIGVASAAIWAPCEASQQLCFNRYSGHQKLEWCMG
jgi:hypothetical protein